MRLLGFTPTKKMIDETKAIHTGSVVDVIHDGPIMETLIVPVVEPVANSIPSAELPTYNKSKILMPLSSKKKAMSDLKRKVNLNPLSE